MKRIVYALVLIIEAGCAASPALADPWRSVKPSVWRGAVAAAPEKIPAPKEKAGCGCGCGKVDCSCDDGECEAYMWEADVKGVGWWLMKGDDYVGYIVPRLGRWAYFNYDGKADKTHAGNLGMDAREAKCPVNFPIPRPIYATPKPLTFYQAAPSVCRS